MHSPYSLQKRLFLLKATKNHQKLAIFKCFNLLKTYKQSFKNGLTFIFHQDMSKRIKKIQI